MSTVFCHLQSVVIIVSECWWSFTKCLWLLKYASWATLAYHADLIGKMDNISGMQPSCLLPFQESGSNHPRKLSPDLLSLINTKFHFLSSSLSAVDSESPFPSSLQWRLFSISSLLEKPRGRMGHREIDIRNYGDFPCVNHSSSSWGTFQNQQQRGNV